MVTVRSRDNPDVAVERRISIGPLVLLLVGGGLALILLFTNHTDGSYTCRGSSITDVINPEPEASADFRRDFFDSGRQCNEDARLHVGAAGGILLVTAGGAFFWHRSRRGNRAA